MYIPYPLELPISLCYTEFRTHPLMAVLPLPGEPHPAGPLFTYYSIKAVSASFPRTQAQLGGTLMLIF
jgi:hypothetical protein